MPNEQLAINTYRRSVSTIIPEMTKVALLVKGDQLRREVPNFNRQHFLYHLSKADYQKSWGSGYQQPGPGARVIAVMFKVVPKVGRSGLSISKSRRPGPKSLSESMDRTIDQYGKSSARSKERRFAGLRRSIGHRQTDEAGEYAAGPTRPIVNCSMSWTMSSSLTSTNLCERTSSLSTKASDLRRREHASTNA